MCAGQFYVKSLLHGVICKTKCQCAQSISHLIKRMHLRFNGFFFYYSISGHFEAKLQGSISVTAQCIETKPMLNESSWKDLQIICWSLLCQIAPSWRDLSHKVSTSIKVFRLYSFFFLSFFLPFFSQRLCYCTGKSVNKVSMKLQMCTDG